MRFLIPPPLEIFYRVSPIFAIIPIWAVSRQLASRLIEVLMPMRFWIYCMHHPVTAWIGAGLHTVLGHSLCAEYLRMAIGPLLCLLIVASIGLCIRKYLPHIYRALNGGR